MINVAAAYMEYEAVMSMLREAVMLLNSLRSGHVQSVGTTESSVVPTSALGTIRVVVAVLTIVRPADTYTTR